ncbi:MAG: low molecular weight phosphotyrosine protein phosphatase [Bacteroidetes bacterium]|nr:low molecular weight phosphotyrosine protein phosphatase [Bacteroidota bacterium]
MKILFVCTGNICRSPMAEGILKDKLRQRNLTDEVDSAGFENFHVGDPPDERATRTARNHSIDITGHRARLFSSEDFKRFDKIYVMDSWHYHNSMNIAGSEQDEAKVDYIMNVLYPGRNMVVQDPWYNGIQSFEEVYHQLDAACQKIANMMETASMQKTPEKNC